jgi:hypothetical protein
LLFENDCLYVGTDADGVFVSCDKGVRWQQLKGGLPWRAQVFDLAIIQGQLFAGLYSKGLYVWHHKDNRWKRSGTVYPLVLASSRDTLIAGHNPGGIYWSDDLGLTWTKGTGSSAANEGLMRALPGDAPVWEAGAHDQHAFVGAADGIFHSTDRGRAWIRASSGFPGSSPGIAFLVTPNLILAATTVKQNAE